MTGANVLKSTLYIILIVCTICTLSACENKDGGDHSESETLPGNEPPFIIGNESIQKEIEVRQEIRVDLGDGVTEELDAYLESLLGYENLSLNKEIRYNGKNSGIIYYRVLLFEHETIAAYEATIKSNSLVNLTAIDVDPLIESLSEEVLSKGGIEYTQEFIDNARREAVREIAERSRIVEQYAKSYIDPDTHDEMLVVLTTYSDETRAYAGMEYYATP